MPDIAALTALVVTLKNATDIAKAIKEAGFSIEKAQAKLRMAALIEALADAKIQASEIQDALREKDNRISELEKAFDFKSKLIRHGDAYYEIDDNGLPMGDPYCSHCWEANHKTVHLNYEFQMLLKICPACKTRYDIDRTKSIQKA